MVRPVRPVRPGERRSTKTGEIMWDGLVPGIGREDYKTSLRAGFSRQRSGLVAKKNGVVTLVVIQRRGLSCIEGDVVTCDTECARATTSARDS